MKRSTHVAAPLLAAAAVSLLSGCHHHPEMQRCVDEQNRVVAESFCQANGVRQQQQGMRPGGLGFYPMYRYYYGGGGGWNVGEPVYGGSYSGLQGHSYTTSSGAAHSSTGTSRGGFGSTHGGSSGSHGAAGS